MSKKNAVLAVADDLAAKSRILRKAATDPDAVLSKLHTLGFEQTKLNAERKETKAAEALASIQPMIDKARAQLADADAAREEAKQFVKKFENVNWDVLRDRFNDWEGATPENPVSTRDRIATIRAAVEELKTMADASDGEFRDYLSRASALHEVESHTAKYAINGLHQRMTLSAGTATTVRNRIKGIKRHLELLGTVLVAAASDAPQDVPQDVPNDAPQAQEAK